MPSEHQNILVSEFPRHESCLVIVIPWKVHLDSIWLLKDLPHITASLLWLIVFWDSAAQWGPEQAIFHSFGFQNVGHRSEHSALLTLFSVFYQLTDSAQLLIFGFFFVEVTRFMNGSACGWCFIDLRFLFGAGCWFLSSLRVIFRSERFGNLLILIAVVTVEAAINFWILFLILWAFLFPPAITHVSDSTRVEDYGVAVT